MTGNTPDITYAQFAAWARIAAPVPPEMADARRAFPGMPDVTLEEWFRRLSQEENEKRPPIRSRTLYSMLCDDEETWVGVEHVYLAEGEAGTCEHCVNPAHDPGLVSLGVGEDLALLTAEQALVIANRLVKAAELVLKSDEDLPDVEREAARFAGNDSQEIAMYPPGDDSPLHGAKPGDRIEHKLMPGFVMKVLDTKRCETDVARPETHDQYKITDPDGNEDWLCAYDVRRAG